VLLASLILGILFRPRIRVPGTRALAMVVGLGVVIAVMNTAFFGAVIHVGLGTATTIEFLGPFVVSVVSAGHRVDLLWACVAVAGVMLIAGAGHLSRPGVALALLAAACRAGYILLTKHVGSTFKRVDGLFIALVVGTLVSFPFAVSTLPAFAHVDVVGLALSVGALSSALPYVCDMFALRRIRATSFGVLLSLSPAVSAVVGLLLLGQALNSLQSLGIVIVVAASLGSVLTGRRRPRT
jgi:inner membrane transporter RhtA